MVALNLTDFAKTYPNNEPLDFTCYGDKERMYIPGKKKEIKYNGISKCLYCGSLKDYGDNCHKCGAPQ